MLGVKGLALASLLLLAGCAYTGVALNEVVKIENGLTARFIFVERVTPSGPSARALYCFLTDGKNTQLADARGFSGNGPVQNVLGKVVPAGLIATGVGVAATGFSNAVNSSAAAAAR